MLCVNLTEPDEQAIATTLIRIVKVRLESHILNCFRIWLAGRGVR